MRSIRAVCCSGVALLFVLEPALPKQKDLTLMDKYVYWSFIFSFCTAVLGFVVEMNPDSNQLSDKMMYGAFAFWGVSHVIFAITAWVMYREEQKKLVFLNYHGDFLDNPLCKRVRKGEGGFLVPANLEEDLYRTRSKSDGWRLLT